MHINKRDLDGLESYVIVKDKSYENDIDRTNNLVFELELSKQKNSHRN